MKSVYVDDTLHQKLKRLAHEHGQTLISLLNRFVQEGIERTEQSRRRPQPAVRDPVGMFGIRGRREIEVERAYGANRYQDAGERDDRF
jgi:hypothetical protein